MLDVSSYIDDCGEAPPTRVRRTWRYEWAGGDGTVQHFTGTLHDLEVAVIGRQACLLGGEPGVD